MLGQVAVDVGLARQRSLGLDALEQRRGLDAAPARLGREEALVDESVGLLLEQPVRLDVVAIEAEGGGRTHVALPDGLACEPRDHRVGGGSEASPQARSRSAAPSAAARCLTLPPPRRAR